jgi:hypothetical protein
MTATGVELGGAADEARLTRAAARQARGDARRSWDDVRRMQVEDTARRGRMRRLFTRAEQVLERARDDRATMAADGHVRTACWGLRARH